MRWAILAVVVVLGLAGEAAAQGPTMTVNLDGNSQTLPLVAVLPTHAVPPIAAFTYHYRATVGTVQWEVNVSVSRADEMQFRVVRPGFINALASSPFLPISGGSGQMFTTSQGAEAYSGLAVTVTP